MAYDDEVGRSSRPGCDEAPTSSGLECRMAGPEVWPRPGEGVRSPLAKKKRRMPTPEGRPFVRSQWGFTSPRPRFLLSFVCPRQPKEIGPTKSLWALIALRAGEIEGAVVAPLEANLPQHEEVAPERKEGAPNLALPQEGIAIPKVEIVSWVVAMS
ncbi:hypothetical protein E2562_005281 [Oryza meyeriana var. granulata]|uniref:Uncharacterized protein n=1 Tax=Oryza meyeriana var. granulata TaxID=110450 RepID=A0A6G1EET5_9ORYZ|nr:hypothetical protein E2562_005281 [Oryza meyeriana var. granulata]